MSPKSRVFFWSSVSMSPAVLVFRSFHRPPPPRDDSLPDGGSTEGVLAPVALAEEGRVGGNATRTGGEANELRSLLRSLPPSTLMAVAVAAAISMVVSGGVIWNVGLAFPKRSRSRAVRERVRR